MTAQDKLLQLSKSKKGLIVGLSPVSNHFSTGPIYIAHFCNLKASLRIWHGAPQTKPNAIALICYFYQCSKRQGAMAVIKDMYHCIQTVLVMITKALQQPHMEMCWLVMFRAPWVQRYLSSAHPCTHDGSFLVCRSCANNSIGQLWLNENQLSILEAESYCSRMFTLKVLSTWSAGQLQNITASSCHFLRELNRILIMFLDI